MMSLTFGLFNQVSGLGPLGPLVFIRNDAEPEMSKDVVGKKFDFFCFHLKYCVCTIAISERTV